MNRYKLKLVLGRKTSNNRISKLLLCRGNKKVKEVGYCINKKHIYIYKDILSCKILLEGLDLSKTVLSLLRIKKKNWKNVRYK